MVPDIRAAVAKAAVCVVPLRIGSGTRLKILESAAMGKPVVSTSIGAEGLDFVDGQEILLADEPGAFAHAVADLLADAPRRQAMGLAARRRLERQYSLRSLCAAVRQALPSLLQELPAVSGATEQELSLDGIRS
jgi:glycosyltransferase involved in cell wall biosynthesis